MKKEGIMKISEENMKSYEENMKKYKKEIWRTMKEYPECDVIEGGVLAIPGFTPGVEDWRYFLSTLDIFPNVTSSGGEGVYSRILDIPPVWSIRHEAEKKIDDKITLMSYSSFLILERNSEYEEHLQP